MHALHVYTALHACLTCMPFQISRSPTLIQHFTFESITQTLVADCSFVSSLAVCAAWERRFGRTLISRNIFPQRNGVPVLSPSGKYIVKMYLNGSVRKITIDDYLPVMQVAAPAVCPVPALPPAARLARGADRRGGAASGLWPHITPWWPHIASYRPLITPYWPHIAHVCLMPRHHSIRYETSMKRFEANMKQYEARIERFEANI